MDQCEVWTKLLEWRRWGHVVGSDLGSNFLSYDIIEKIQLWRRERTHRECASVRRKKLPCGEEKLRKAEMALTLRVTLTDGDDVREIGSVKWRWPQRRRQCEMAMTSEKTAVWNGDDVTEDSDGRRQLPLCELTTIEILHLQLPPTLLRRPNPGERIYLGNQACATWRRCSSGDATGLSRS